MRSALGSSIRYTSTLLILLLTWDGLAHAARPSGQIAALQAFQQQQAPASTAPAVTASPAPAPVPGPSVRERLQAAHTVYLAAPIVDPHFGASGTDVYNAVLDALQQWGRYRVVSDAAKADLRLQLHGKVTVYSTPGPPPDYLPQDSYSSTLQLLVQEPGTSSPLWETTVPLQGGARSKTRTVHIAISGENAVSALKLAAGDSLTRQDRAGLKAMQTGHQRSLAFILFGVGGAAVLAIVGIHLAHSDASSFCKQHNLSPCPGA